MLGKNDENICNSKFSFNAGINGMPKRDTDTKEQDKTTTPHSMDKDQ